MPLPGPGQHRAGLKLRYWGQTYSQHQLNSFQRQDQRGSKNFQQNEKYKFYLVLKNAGKSWNTHSLLQNPLTMHFYRNWNQDYKIRDLHKYWENNFNDFTGIRGCFSLTVPQHCSLYPFPLTITEPIIYETRTLHEISAESAEIPAILNWSLNSLDSLLGCWIIFLPLLLVLTAKHNSRSFLSSAWGGNYQKRWN